MTSSVNIDFNANLTRFTSAIDKATNDLNKFQSNASRIGGNINKAFGAIGVGLSVAGLASFVKGSIDALDNLNDLSKSTGVAVEQLAGLDLAARQSGSDLESVAQSINKLSVNLGKDADKFKELGITAKDPLEAFKQLADIYNSIEDPQKRAAFAAEALGKSWQGAAPLLAEGSKRIGEMVARGTELSGVTKASAEQADAFNDQLEELSTLSGRVGVELGKIVVPALTGFAKTVADASAEGSYFEGVLNRLKLAATLAAPAIAGAIGLASKAESGGQGRSGSIGRITPPAADAQGFEELTKGLRLTSVELEKIKVREDEAKKSFDAGKITLAQYNEIVKALSKERKTLNKSSGSAPKQNIDADIEAAKRFVASLTDEAATLGLTGTALKAYEAAHLKLKPAQREIVDGALAKIDAFEEEKTRLDKLTEAYEEHNKQIDDFNQRETDAIEEQGAFDAESVKSLSDFVDGLERARDPSIELLDNIGKIQSAVSLGIISVEQGDEYAKYLEDAAKKTEETTDDITLFWKKAAENMQDAMSDFFFDVMQGNLSDLAASFKSTIDRMVANMLAARAATSLFGEEFTSGKSDVIGGIAGKVFGGIGDFFGDLLPSFAVGTPYVPHDMVANIHKGERILTADENRKFSSGQMGGGGNIYMTVNATDAGSFMRSSKQIAQVMQRQLNQAGRVS
jgi:hypothetical protein